MVRRLATPAGKSHWRNADVATLYLTIPAFSITSSWRRLVTIYTPPSTGYVVKKISAAVIPYGSTIQKAELRVQAQTGYSGGTLRINGSTERTQDITDRIHPNSVGNYTDIQIDFGYTAYGNVGDKPSTNYYSTCNVSSVEIEITYESGVGTVIDPEKFRAASLSIAREIRPRAVVTYPSGAMQPIDHAGIISFSINEGIKSGVLLGAVSSSVLEMRLANQGGEWMPGGAMRGTRTPLGAKIGVEIGLLIDGEWMYQPAGTFTIDKFVGKATDPTVTITGYDAMATEMEKPFSDSLSYPQTLSAILTHISEKAKIGYIGHLAANGDVQITQKPEWGENCTFRQALAYVCQAGASYGQMTRGGILGIFPTWREDQQLSLAPDNYMENSHDERLFSFNWIHVTPFDNGKETIKSRVDSSIGSNSSNTLKIEKNPLFVSTQTAAQTMADGIASALSGAKWRASDFRWRGDPAVEIGCRVDIRERSGDVFQTTIMSQNMKWDRGFSMQGRCEIDIGRAFADLGYDETALGGLPVGSKIRIDEENGQAWYTLVAADYSGGCLLLRDEKIGDGQYSGEKPSSVYASKYAGTYIDNAMTAFYTALPEGTKSIIMTVSVPVRADASSAAAAGTLERNAFALSAVELGFDGSVHEGKQIDYLGTVNIGDDYWTREPVSGMTGYAYIVNASGNRGTDLMTTQHGRRPAFCVYKNTSVKSVDGGFAPVTTRMAL
jgi:hypothetical protein